MSPTLLIGRNNEYILFKVAINIAEMGFGVWFINPKSFSQIPENITPPDKEILKLITFMYLENENKLLERLHSVHVWHRIPHCIIINSFEYYSKLTTTNYDTSYIPFLVCNMLDAINTCTLKHNQKACLLVSCNAKSDEVDENLLKILNDLYFENVYFCEERNTSVIDNIIQHVRNSNIKTENNPSLQ